MVSEDFIQGTDTLASEQTVTAEIDTGSETSPYTLVTPPPGKRIATRTVVIQTDSAAGEIAIRFATTGTPVHKIFCSKFYGNPAPDLNVKGSTDEGVVVEWSDLSTGAKVFVALTYKIA
ncbi:MAG: hypothetical protein JRE40_16230 [Deltaproteobacteria bacterium]|nr:hypothetical protein [Deltaproteobacteria bacterium]